MRNGGRLTFEFDGEDALLWIMSNIISEVPKMTKQRTRKPTHPGIVFKLDVMDELGMNVTAVAKALGVSRKHMSAFINGRVPCSKDMAQRIAIATDTSMKSWLNMQVAYDVWEAEHNPREEMKAVQHIAAA